MEVGRLGLAAAAAAYARIPRDPQVFLCPAIVDAVASAIVGEAVTLDQEGLNAAKQTLAALVAAQLFQLELVTAFCEPLRHCAASVRLLGQAETPQQQP